MARISCKRLSFKQLLCGVCACVNSGVTFTLLVSLNALFSDWIEAFGASRSRTAAIQSVCFGVALGAGLAAGMLQRKLGERVSLLLGTVLATAGFLAGAFVTSLPALIVCVGVVTGSGFCLLQLSTVSTTLRRFPNRAPLMSSAMASCSSLASLGTPLLFRYLSDQYTWRGTLILAAGIVLHTAIFSLLLTSPLLLHHHHPATPPPSSPRSSRHRDVTPGPDVIDCTQSDRGIGRRSAKQSHGTDGEQQSVCIVEGLHTDVEQAVDGAAEDNVKMSQCTDSVQGRDDLHVRGSHDLHVQGSDDLHVHGRDDLHVQGTNDLHVQGTGDLHVQSINDLYVQGRNDPDVQGTNDLHVQGTEDPHVQGINDLHVQGTDDLHVQGRDDLHVQGTNDLHVQSINDLHVQGRNDPYVQGTNDLHVQGTDDLHVQGTDDLHVQGTDDLHVQGTADLHVQGTNELHVQYRDDPDVQGTNDLHVQGTKDLHEQSAYDLRVQGTDDLYVQGSKELVLSVPLSETSIERQGSPDPELSKQSPRDVAPQHMRDSCYSRFRSHTTFLKNPLYVSVTLCTVVLLSTVVSFVFLVLDFAALKGWSAQDGVFLNLVFQVSSLTFRLLAGVASLHRRVRTIGLLVAAGVIGSVGLCFVGQVGRYDLAAVAYCSLGGGYGALIVMFPAAVLELTGPGAVYPVALGLLCTLEGALDAGTGILTGYVVDILHSYSVISLVYGILSLMSTLLLLLVFMWRTLPSNEA